MVGLFGGEASSEESSAAWSWIVIVDILFIFVSWQMMQSFSRLIVLADCHTAYHVNKVNFLLYWPREFKSALLVKFALSFV